MNMKNLFDFSNDCIHWIENHAALIDCIGNMLTENCDFRGIP